jgi:RNA polymerase sigma-70 factor (ECF subfamily)
VNSSASQLEDTARDTDETALLARARAGDADAVAALISKYVKDVFAVTARLLDDRDLAQDAAQDALVNALKGLKRFRGEASFRTWLLRIAVNAARTVGRKRTRRREVSLEVVSESAVDLPDAATLASQNADVARAAALLAKLPEKQRMAVSLRIQQGLSYQEIGALLDCSEGAARVNYHLGVKRLRELMK